MNLEELAKEYRQKGYSEENAQARVCPVHCLRPFAPRSFQHHAPSFQ